MSFLIMLALLFPGESKIGWLGIKGQEVSKPYLVALKLEYGVIIIDVLEDSPAQDADLKIGDIITEIDKITIYDMDDIADLVRRNPGAELDFKIIRSGKKKDIEVKIGEEEEDLTGIRKEIRKALKELKKELERLKNIRI